MKELYKKIKFIKTNNDDSIEIGPLCFPNLIETKIYLLSKINKNILEDNIKKLKLGIKIVNSIPNNENKETYCFIDETEEGITFIELPYIWLFNTSIFRFENERELKLLINQIEQT